MNFNVEMQRFHIKFDTWDKLEKLKLRDLISGF